METQIKALLNSLSVTGRYMGYQATVIACEVLLEDEMILYSVAKKLYPKVSEKCGCSEKTVERNIRTIIMRCWDTGRERLFEIAGFKMTEPPTVTEFLGILISYIQRSQLVSKN